MDGTPNGEVTAQEVDSEALLQQERGTKGRRREDGMSIAERPQWQEINKTEHRALLQSSLSAGRLKSTSASVVAW